MGEGVLDEGNGEDSGSLERGAGSMESDLAEARRRCRIRIIAQIFEMGERRNGTRWRRTDETEGMEMRREPLVGLGLLWGHSPRAMAMRQTQGPNIKTAHFCAGLPTLTGRVHCFLHSPTAPCPIT
jgi:hypothetical protein